MNTEIVLPDQEELDRRKLAFAKEWMKRKRQEQQQMIEDAKTNPAIIALHNELKRQNQERGTCIVEL